MKQTTYIILTIITLIFIVVFTLQNTSEVSIAILFWNTKTSLALLIFSLFSLGMIIAIFILTPIIIALKSTLKKDKKIISELQ
ncbi:lipopolysaccharide assembly protein LapA domain-containing protein [Maribacter sp. ACAM166]|uniref:lipopolysaccharide assembly protein LapA domain-containing protein n=1 Tax=Maribacter sp. ACAM166 TaxID=2508996 RepID=UPI0010FD7F24|nr:LapA family protein [Maribacter sp. ACAM166]TLP72862.1 LapA family protein [Maribacter sp. ACAM166]